jgi:hypothetical protein
MRVSAFGLLALAGCNQIFGLDAVTVVDAAGPPDAPFPRVRLSHQVAGTKIISSPAIADPDPALAYPPIAPAPRVRIGTLTDALVDTSYDPTDGGIEVSLPDLFGTTWRLEYTIPGAPPHEVHWTPVMDEAHLVVPVVGRLDRGTAPANSGYDVQPIGTVPPAPTSFIASHVFMTGVFVDILTVANPKDAQIDAPSSRFDGALGNPALEQGDYAVLVNYDLVLNGTCPTVANGFAGFRPPPLQSGVRSAPSPQPTWSVSDKTQVALTYRNLGFGLDLRLGSALGGKRSGTLANVLQHGHVASTLLPGFTHASQDVPSPLLFSLANCQLGIASTTEFVAPIDIAAFPRVTYANLSSARTTAGVKLTSSIATVTASAPPQADVIDFGVPIASAPIVLAAGGETFDISTDADTDDTITIPAGPGTFELTFALETEQANLALAVDYFETTVFRFEGSMLVPERVIISTEVAAAAPPAPRVITAPIRIDRSLFVAPNRYVIAIRTFRGRPGAARGDFTTVAYPQSVATVFTHTILAQ